MPPLYAARLTSVIRLRKGSLEVRGVLGDLHENDCVDCGHAGTPC